MRLGKYEIENPLILGPMAGVTDWAFRTICAELGANITITEMVSSRALVYKDQKSAALLRKNEGSLCGAQIFGNNPAIMAEAAVMALEISGCDFLDINMGCPMPKIANSGDGCGLMRTPELAGEIVEAVVKAVDVPVTVKCRLGWDKSSLNVVYKAHGRLRCLYGYGSRSYPRNALFRRCGLGLYNKGQAESIHSCHCQWRHCFRRDGGEVFEAYWRGRHYDRSCYLWRSLDLC